MELSERIKAARKHAGLSQATLAQRVGVTRGAVTNWEISARANPSITHLVDVAAVTEVSFEWLASGNGQMLPLGTDNVLQFGEAARTRAELRLLRAYRRNTEYLQQRILELVEAPLAHTA